MHYNAMHYEQFNRSHPEGAPPGTGRALRQEQRPASDVVRDSLRRYIAAQKFRRLRRKTLPFAEAQGFLTDEDVFEAVS